MEKKIKLLIGGDFKEVPLTKFQEMEESGKYLFLSEGDYVKVLETFRG